MEHPFRFLEGKVTSRMEFQIIKGPQPTLALIYLKEGCYSIEIDGKKTMVKKGECSIFPDDIDFLRTVVSPISFIYVKFTVNPTCPIVFPLPHGKVVIQDKKRFRNNIEKYETLIGNTSPQAVYYREHILEDLLLQISLEYTNGYLFHSEDANALETAIANCRDPIVNAAVRFIRAQLDQKITIDRICRAIGTNSSTLNFKFRKELSHPVGEFIIMEKMKQAAQFLTNTSFSISEIANRCGFENVYYFSNSFRKFYKMPPSAYRKEHR